MKKLTSKEVRKIWLDFWKSKNHQVIESKSLIPKNDPSLLWINSGVATLKDYFSGKKIPSNPRITNSQKSIRTNDIENVGITSRHHTLFEMLGNFSIGDYFKNEALKWAYELLFDVFKFDKDKIYITYYDQDKETYKKWIELGIDEEHLISGTKETNFWDVGQGPCGPDTEIFYDRGPKYDPKNIGLKLLKDDLENDRYIEIWNIVFSQFNNDGEGNYTELIQKNIDTGAGLERLVSIFQDAPTNFDTDLFLPIIHKIESLTNSQYDINNYFINDEKQNKINKNFRIIADHSRAIINAIQDGAKPSNTARGYIIRRLLRRAYRALMQLNNGKAISLTNLTEVIADILDIYKIDVKKVNEVILKEEEAFSKTIKQGEQLLLDSIKGKDHLDAKIAFKLFETYGFPIELTQEILEEKGIQLDIEEFNKLNKEHAKKSRGNKKVKGMDSQIQVIQEINKLQSEFIGYDYLEYNAKVLFSKKENDLAYSLFDKTPFYATSGGQEKDKGAINKQEVINVFKDKHGNIWHVTKEIVNTDKALLKVSEKIRLQKERNHSATHLLNKVLREIYGDTITQLGSYNDEHKLRFDFPLDHKLTDKEIEVIDNKVNEYIKKDFKRNYIETTFDKGKELGALTLEDEDYGEIVRVVDFNISKEFCGGTHVSSTGKIEEFKITKVESKGSGIYRIEAITSKEEIKKYNDNQIKSLEKELNPLLEKYKKVQKNIVFSFKKSISSMKNAISTIKKELKKINKKPKKVDIDFDAITFVKENGINVYKETIDNPSMVKIKAITLREKFPEALFIIETITENGTLIAVASKIIDCNSELRKRYPSIKGGGSKEFAMGSLSE